VLGLSAAIITPIIPFFVLVEAVNYLSLPRGSRAIITALGCISIILGAALPYVEGLSSEIAVTKMQGELPSAGILPLELQSLYILLIILVLGLISIFFSEEKVKAMEMQAFEGIAAHEKMAIWVLDYSCLQEPFFLLVWHSESISRITTWAASSRKQGSTTPP